MAKPVAQISADDAERIKEALTASSETLATASKLAMELIEAFAMIDAAGRRQADAERIKEALLADPETLIDATARAPELLDAFAVVDAAVAPTIFRIKAGIGLFSDEQLDLASSPDAGCAQA